ncbi:hypothetical protein A6070_02280 [Syntrophotalea acetylenica]|nr:hypothetical protein A6070_02280 [Syntrophotalea acetylenica]
MLFQSVGFPLGRFAGNAGVDEGNIETFFYQGAFQAGWNSFGWLQSPARREAVAKGQDANRLLGHDSLPGANRKNVNPRVREYHQEKNNR